MISVRGRNGLYRCLLQGRWSVLGVSSATADANKFKGGAATEFHAAIHPEIGPSTLSGCCGCASASSATGWRKELTLSLVLWIFPQERQRSARRPSILAVTMIHILLCLVFILASQSSCLPNPKAVSSATTRLNNSHFSGHTEAVSVFFSQSAQNQTSQAQVSFPRA